MLALRAVTAPILRSHPQSTALLTRATTHTKARFPGPSLRPPTPSPYRPLGPPKPTQPLPSPHSSKPGLATLLAASSASLGSLCGVGGAVFLIPALVRYIGLPQRLAAGNSLVAVSAIATTSAATFFAAGNVHPEVAVPLGAAATLLTPVGAAASAYANPTLLRKLLGGFMLLLAPAMPLRAHLERVRSDPHPPTNPTSLDNSRTPTDPNKPNTALLTVLGAGVGFGSALLGISGGSLFTPLVAVTCPDISFRSVLGTSFAAMIVPTTVGAVSYARMGCVSPALLPPLVVGAVAGAGVGSVAALNVREDTLRWAFAIIFAVLGGRVLRKPITAPSSTAVASGARAKASASVVAQKMTPA